ncbi:hypothetical protein BGZ50_002044, partial [Haplosporangium sp. Z 11]
GPGFVTSGCLHDGNIPFCVIAPAAVTLIGDDDDDDIDDEGTADKALARTGRFCLGSVIVATDATVGFSSLYFFVAVLDGDTDEETFTLEEEDASVMRTGWGGPAATFELRLLKDIGAFLTPFATIT